MSWSVCERCASNSMCWQKIDASTNGYKAAVISGLIGSFEEKYWWWKVR